MTNKRQNFQEGNKKLPKAKESTKKQQKLPTSNGSYQKAIEITRKQKIIKSKGIYQKTLDSKKKQQKLATKVCN